MKYIYHHLGLGDHIICNGLVRYFKEIYSEVSVFCKPHNFNNVSYMYRDDDKIKVLSIGDDNDVYNYIVNNKITNETIWVGFHLMNESIGTFDECFYKIVDLPFEYRFSKFKLQRDFVKEKIVYDELNPKNDKYIFIHGKIDLTKVRSDLKIIENPENYNIFEILKLIENAEEVHLMESSIKCLVNSFEFEKPNFFYHQYVRGYTEWLNSKGKNKFKTIY
jgi:hypothetical protein